MTRLRHIGSAIVVVLAIAAGSPASDAATLMEQGWEEYGFQSFDAAGRLFAQAEREARDEGPRRQARLGRAMVDQFRESRTDVQRAMVVYRDLRDQDPNDSVGVMATSFLAEALAGLGDLDEANALWHTVITEHADSMTAQDALLRRTVANLGGSWLALERAVRYGTLTREEIEALDLNGVTPEILDEVMMEAER